MNNYVEAYAGGSHPETPRTVIWAGQRYAVQTVLKRWREPHGLGFVVACTPGNIRFDLFYHAQTAQWQIQRKEPAVDHKPLTQS